MSTAISSEREAIVRTLRDFCEAEIRPNVMKWDEAQEFPVEIFRKLGELGFLGVLFPEKLGGAGLSYMDYQAGKLENYDYPAEAIAKALDGLPPVQ